MADLDPYQTLNVSKTATQEEIKEAYRKLAKQYHPDLNPGNPAAEKKFKEISLAYDRIGTPEQKAKYDRGEFAQGFGPGGPHAERRGPFYSRTQGASDARYSYSFGEEDLGPDFFGSIFGRASSKQDEHYQLEIDFVDAVRGATRELTLPSGKKLEVRIPAGVESGTKLRFADQGARGDVYVDLRVRPSRLFRRDGHNLSLELPVSLAEAVLGGEARVPTIDGSVMLKIPPRVSAGTKLRIPGKGMLDRKTGRRGDQIVTLRIVLPKEIDSEFEQAIRAWSERSSYNPREGFAA